MFLPSLLPQVKLLNNKNFTWIKRTKWNNLGFFTSACKHLLKNNNFWQQGLQIAAWQRRYSKCKSENPNLSKEIEKNPNFSSNSFLEKFGYKEIEPLRFLKVCYEKSAQTDVSKEMCIPILKGLKHLNIVLNC